MYADDSQRAVHLDVAGSALAGLINTFLASFVAVIVVGPGSPTTQADVSERIAWIAENTLRWQAGWLFWFAVTLSFAWSYFAIARHLKSKHPWTSIAVGLAVIATSVDLVGVVINITVVPMLAKNLLYSAGDTLLFELSEHMAYALINVTAFGVYTAAGLLLLPAMFSTRDYPRWMAWLGVAEWGIAAVATALLLVAPDYANGPLMVSFALYAPWVWSNAWWIWRRKRPQG